MNRGHALVDQIAAWINKHFPSATGKPNPVTLNANLPRGLRLGLGAVSVSSGIVYAAIWLHVTGGFIFARAAMALAVIGFALLLGLRLLKTEEPLASAERAPGDPWLQLLGCPNNLAVAQLIAVASMIVFGLRWEIDAAWWSAAIALVLVTPLYQSKASIASMAMGATGLLYLLYSLAVDGIGRIIEADAYARELPVWIVPVGTILWVSAALALLPQLQLVRVGRVGIGSLKGDTSVRLFGSRVPVALTSSVLLVSLFEAAPALFYLPTSIKVALGG